MSCLRVGRGARSGKRALPSGGAALSRVSSWGLSLARTWADVAAFPATLQGWLKRKSAVSGARGAVTWKSGKVLCSKRILSYWKRSAWAEPGLSGSLVLPAS